MYGCPGTGYMSMSYVMSCMSYICHIYVMYIMYVMYVMYVMYGCNHMHNFYLHVLLAARFTISISTCSKQQLNALAQPSVFIPQRSILVLELLAARAQLL